MAEKRTKYNRTKELEKELDELRHQLDEANETIQAIRTGQIDALVVQSSNGHQLYTLKTADQTYRVFIEKMTEGAVTISPQGLILYCNSRFASMVGLPLSNVIGLPFEQFISEEYKDRYLELFKKCWKDDCKGEVYLTAGQDRVPVLLSLTTLELQEGVSLSIILTDLTDQKAAQQQLKKNNEQLEEINLALESSNEALLQFASVASHDLQEPVRKIQIFSNLLKQKQLDLDPSARAYLEKIIDSSGRMRTLILDILSYSRLSYSEAALEYTDLTELVNELTEDLELVIEEKKATINSDQLPCVNVNRGQMRQVFTNILTNSLKFSRQGVPPVINITSRRIKERSFTSIEHPNGSYVLISIQDNGIGFDEKYINNVFALFERLNAKDKYEGTGIGLAIAKRIIDKHNGLITASSIEGEGSTFKVILPLSKVKPDK